MRQYLCNDQKLEQETNSRHYVLGFARVLVKLASADINKIMDLELERDWGGVRVLLRRRKVKE